MQRSTPAVRRWLLVVYLMVFAMVLIGGITRLTGSGLSMVEWRPLMGLLPPLTDAEWQRVFTIYQQSPQYAEVNGWMGLADFQRIFFWEYLHRLFGRLIGLVVMVPGIYFLARRRLQGRAAKWVIASFVFGGMQGVLGWWMVKSGLVDRPEVSHFRLAAHLSLALFVGCWIWWLMLDLRTTEAREGRPSLRRWGWIFMAVLAVQIVYGAFMAGTRAGYMYRSWPDMNGEFWPSAALSMPSANLTSNPVFIHFFHRTLAWGVLALGLWHAWRLRVVARKASIFLASSLFLQFLLGVGTIVLGMPIAIAAAHQGGALLLLSAGLVAIHAVSPRAATPL
ncbi:MAG: cytochrome c oxidase assembly protein subunit 15 [Bradymonadia bacterium]|jgi:cytochrome c oxidase assembly protein subunit 15